MPATTQIFCIAAHTLAGMKEHYDAIGCFNPHYAEQAPNLKRRADTLGISRPTYYSRSGGIGP